MFFFFGGQRDPTSFCTKMLSDVGDMVCCWALRDPGITTSQRLRWSLWFDLNESNYGWVYCIYTYLYILHVHTEHIDVLPWEYIQIIIEWHVLFNIECMIDDTICIYHILIYFKVCCSNYYLELRQRAKAKQRTTWKGMKMAFLLGISKSFKIPYSGSVYFIQICWNHLWRRSRCWVSLGATAALRLIWRRHGHTHVHSAAWWTVGKGKVSFCEVSRKRESCLYRSINMSFFIL